MARMNSSCKHCGEGFAPVRPWQVFCSDAHRAAYWRESGGSLERQHKTLQRQAYVMGMRLLQSDFYPSADTELKAAIDAAVEEPCP